jgi:hypothetical protein
MAHAFPQGKLLLYLTELCIEAAGSCSEAVGYWDKDQHEYRHGFMDTDSLPAVFAACPSLVSLSIRNALAPGDLTPLLQLPTSVVTIDVGGEAFDDAAAAVVGQLTQLRNLSWEGSVYVTGMGLQELTALQGLEWLMVLSTPGVFADGLADGAGCAHGDPERVHVFAWPHAVGVLIWQKGFSVMHFGCKSTVMCRTQ